MPTFIVKCGEKALKVIPPNKVTFIDEIKLANSYASRYAAKSHLKQLDDVPNNVQIIEVNHNG